METAASRIPELRAIAPCTVLLAEEDSNFRSTAHTADHPLPGIATGPRPRCNTSLRRRGCWFFPDHRRFCRGGHPMRSENMRDLDVERNCATGWALECVVHRDRQGRPIR